MKKLLCAILFFALAVLVSSCSQESSEMQDGYYTAEAASFDSHGWKEFITIYVSDNKIVTVEYNAYNASGFIKSWDMNYMRDMNMSSGTYPNEYARAYAVSLLNWQIPADVDAISGATSSYKLFQRLSEAAIEQARAGDKQVALVELPEPHAETTEGK